MTKEQNSISTGGDSPVIGTLREYALHHALKSYFLPDTRFHEQQVGPYVADIRCGNEIVEIQSRDFYRMKQKLRYFLDQGFSVTVVYPVAAEKWLVWVSPDTGELVSRRRSPLRGKPSDIFQELRYLLDFLAEQRLSFVVVMTRVEELRQLKPSSKHPRKGGRHLQRSPLEVMEEYRLASPKDYLAITPAPSALPEQFTVKEYAVAQGCTQDMARLALRVLRQLKVVLPTGKVGRFQQYCWNPEILENTASLSQEHPDSP